ncbi:MAG: hypothetical protein AUI16_16480 [Alphaproteobacteria bacterium 13_2_20CM_2_64_7]|nr:MAG: hypothetical protein AUI16_16480 [Alphaproteobacteria bacterium 13_2_20CM_2_64_7]
MPLIPFSKVANLWASIAQPVLHLSLLIFVCLNHSELSGNYPGTIKDNFHLVDSFISLWNDIDQFLAYSM